MAALREILIAFGMTVDASPLDKAEGKVDGFLSKIKEAGAALAGAFAVKKLWDFEQSMVSVGDEVGDAAALMDLSTQSLEQWRYAADQAEISGDELSAMFLKISKSANSAGDEGSATAKILKDKLHIDVKDFKSSEDAFETVGIALAGMKAGFERTALAAQLFGKSGGVKILQLFKDGAGGIAQYRKEFYELGGGMGDFVDKAGEVDQEQKKLNFAWTNTKVMIAGVLLPAFRWVIESAIKITVAFQKLVKGTSLVQTALVVMGAIAGAKAALIIIQYAPIIATFLLWAAAIAFVVLALEDIYGFFTGKNSLIGKAIDEVFGKGAQERVREWAAKVWDFVRQTGLHFVEIFTNSSTTVWQKFQELVAYFEGAFAEKAKEIFGAIGGDVIAQMASAVTEVIGLFAGAADSIRTIFGGVFKYISEGIFQAIDGAANIDAQNNAEIAAGKAPATAADFDTAKRPWYERAAAAVVGFKPEDAVPVKVPSASSNTTNTTNAPIVNQNFAVAPGTPAAQQQALASAAAKGTTAALQAPNRAAAASLKRTGKKS